MWCSRSFVTPKLTATSIISYSSDGVHRSFVTKSYGKGKHLSQFPNETEQRQIRRQIQYCTSRKYAMKLLRILRLHCFMSVFHFIILAVRVVLAYVCMCRPICVCVLLLIVIF